MKLQPLIHCFWVSASQAHGVEGPLLGASALLFLSSLPRFAEGPIHAMLSVTLTATGVYYATVMYRNNQ